MSLNIDLQKLMIQVKGNVVRPSRTSIGGSILQRTSHWLQSRTSTALSSTWTLEARAVPV